MRQTFLFLLLLCSLSVCAGKYDKETRKVLDKTVSLLTTNGGVSFKFIVINQPNTANQQRTSGNMDVMGQKFVFATPDMRCWFDGKQQWSMATDDSEVNLSAPTESEQQAMNPSLLLQLYKKGFYYKMSQGTLTNGETGYKIYLNADNKKQKIREMYVEVSKAYQLVRISMREGKSNWTRIVLSQLETGKTFPTGHFTFPAKQYPEAEIIDLR